jgi:hypothetical protein
VHHKKVAIFFPLYFVFNGGKGIEGVGEIRRERPFQPDDIFYGIAGVLGIVKMIEPIKLLFKFDYIGI